MAIMDIDESALSGVFLDARRAAERFRNGYGDVPDLGSTEDLTLFLPLLEEVMRERFVTELGALLLNGGSPQHVRPTDDARR